MVMTERSNLTKYDIKLKTGTLTFINLLDLSVAITISVVVVGGKVVENVKLPSVLSEVASCVFKIEEVEICKYEWFCGWFLSVPGFGFFLVKTPFLNDVK